MTVDSNILCEYDVNGKLIVLYDESVGFHNEMEMYLGEDGTEKIRRLYTFNYDESNKIQEITRLEWTESVHVNSMDYHFEPSEDGLYMEQIPYANDEEKQKMAGQKIPKNIFKKIDILSLMRLLISE